MISITNNHKRGVLQEGRDNGMAFAFLKQVKANTFQTVQPPSPCKDYLAEVVFTEKHGIPTRAYGLNYKQKENIFKDGNAYMAIKMVKTTDGDYDYSDSYEEDVKLLAKNYNNIERLINQFETKLKIKQLTTIANAGKGYFLVKFSTDWCQSTHAISLYTLLVRVLMVATDEDKDIMSFLKSYTYNYGDQSLINQCLGKIELIFKEKKLPPNTIPYSASNLKKYMSSPHNNGIVSWRSSFEEVGLSA